MRERSRRNERLLGRMKEYILDNGAAAASTDTAGGIDLAVRDKNRRYEEYRWRPVECSCQYLNDTVTRPLVDSVRIQCGSRRKITFRIAPSFGRTIQLINFVNYMNRF